MAANNAEEPRMGASQDKLSDSSAASSDANTITGDSSLTVGKLEYFKGAPEVCTFPPSFRKMEDQPLPHIYAH